MTIKPISKFIDGGKTYIEDAAHYLEARGLTIQEVSISPLIVKNHGLTLGQGGDSYPLVGWAYRIRGFDDEFLDNQYLLRPCNYRNDLYHDKKLWVDRPKFIQTSREPLLHFCGGPKMLQAPVVAIHEKISSAEIMHKRLGVPCIAISGCTGWGKGGVMHAGLEKVLRNLEFTAKVAIFFDGDIFANPAVAEAAAKLKSSIFQLRADILVSILALPTQVHGTGWDDWAQASTDADWYAVVEQEGIELPDILPLPYLVREYGVTTCEVKRRPQLEQTASNYTRLLRNPRWAGYRWDISGDVYLDDTFAPNGFEYDFICWLERDVCTGYGKEVSRNKIKEAVASFREPRTECMALRLAQLHLPIPSLEECRTASEVLWSQAWRVTGPLRGAELVETWLRFCRDAARRWRGEAGSDAQSILAMVGPTGCGKSTFLERHFGVAEEIGLHCFAKGELNTVPPGKETLRMLRDNLVAVHDDLNGNMNESEARALINSLYAATSYTKTRMRNNYEERATHQVLRALPLLTTVEPLFIRTGKNTGERRFIPIEVEGVEKVGDKWRGSDSLIRQCGRVLLAGMAHGVLEQVVGMATELSERYVLQYVRNSSAHEDLESSKIPWDNVTGLGPIIYRPATQDYRFANPLLLKAMGVEGHTKGGRARSPDLCALFLECGAKKIGKAACFIPLDGNIKAGAGVREVDKDSALSVENWGDFVEKLMRKLA